MFENDSAVYQLKLLQTVIISWFKTVLQFRFSLYFFTNRRPNPDPFFSLIFAECSLFICLTVFLSLTKFYFLRTASMQILLQDLLASVYSKSKISQKKLTIHHSIKSYSIFVFQLMPYVHSSPFQSICLNIDDRRIYKL